MIAIRARALIRAVAPMARPLIATVAIGWGISVLQQLVDERRAELAELDAEKAQLGNDVRRLLVDVHTAAEQLRDYRLRTAALAEQERDDEGEVPTTASAYLSADVFVNDAQAVPVDEHGAPVNPDTGVAFG